jgi:hypothetical protein
MVDPGRLVDAGEGMVKLPREKELPLPKNRGAFEEPITALWSVFGKPSDLVLVQMYAQRLGVSIRWAQMQKDPESTIVVRGERRVIPESDKP